MKKIIASFSVFFCVTLSVFASTNTDSWYQYNAITENGYSFSVLFPTTWEVTSLGNSKQSLAPATTTSSSIVIEEFIGKSYSQAANFYNGLLEIEDSLLKGRSEIIAKTASYSDGKTRTFIKRGSLMLVFTDKVNTETSATIIHSLKFTDNWQQYIDFEEQYSLVFPNNLKIKSLENEIQISDSGIVGSIIFIMQKYAGSPHEEAADQAALPGESLEKIEESSFHASTPSYLATYKNSETGQKLQRIILKRETASFVLSSTNITDNYPHLDYYDETLTEILESLQFFTLAGEYYPYLYFTDVRNNHQNKSAINWLKENSVIDGYEDGSFQPDAAINRAELSKIVVASKKDPDPEKYKNCFPDVTDQWFAPFVCYAKEQGWVDGYPDSTFKPEKEVNRVEALKIILETILAESLSNEEALKGEVPNDISLEDWYSKYYIFADNKDLLDKQHMHLNNFYPSGASSRKEVAETVYRAMQ